MAVRDRRHSEPAQGKKSDRKCALSSADGYDDKRYTKVHLAHRMARVPEPLTSPTILKGCAPFRRTLAASLALAVSLLASPRAQAADPDPWFGRDKAMHFSVSFALAGDGYAGAAGASKRTSVRLVAGAGIAFSAGIAKEVCDRSSGGDASWRDLTWDAVGTATGTLVAWLVDRYLF